MVQCPLIHGRATTQSTWTWEESSPFVPMIMILFIIIVAVVGMVKRRRRRTSAKRTHLRPLSSPQRQVPNEITIDQSIEDEDIGETTT
jgi:hypothetical protein